MSSRVFPKLPVVFWWFFDVDNVPGKQGNHPGLIGWEGIPCDDESRGCFADRASSFSFGSSIGCSRLCCVTSSDGASSSSRSGTPSFGLRGRGLPSACLRSARAVLDTEAAKGLWPVHGDVLGLGQRAAAGDNLTVQPVGLRGIGDVRLQQPLDAGRNRRVPPLFLPKPMHHHSHLVIGKVLFPGLKLGSLAEELAVVGRFFAHVLLLLLFHSNLGLSNFGAEEPAALIVVGLKLCDGVAVDGNPRAHRVYKFTVNGGRGLGVLCKRVTMQRDAVVKHVRKLAGNRPRLGGCIGNGPHLLEKIKTGRVCLALLLVPPRRCQLKPFEGWNKAVEVGKRIFNHTRQLLRVGSRFHVRHGSRLTT
eukprot:m.171657 g.171657  ORF g.171657 m.171657 type:complete len:362 (+) comp17845_c0_seq2:1633-2718(+)